MRKYTPYASLLAITSLIPFAAFAQDSGKALEEITVTAQKREQGLQEVPMAVSTLTDAQMQKAGVFRANDLALIVPNLNVTSPHAAGAPNFSMRGISVGNEFNYNQASPIGVYVDEVYLAARFTHGANLYDLERVEVMRGPQGTLYGRNTTGGAVNFITRKPSLDGEPHGYLTLGAGDWNRAMVEGAFDVSLSDTFGIRAAAKYVKTDDFMENINPSGKDGQGTDSLAARVAARFSNDRWDVIARAYVSNEKPGGTGVIALGSGPDNRNIITGACRCDANGGQPLTDLQFDSSNTGDIDIDANGVNLTVNFGLTDSLDLVSISAWDRSHIAQPAFDWSGSPVSVGNGNWKADNEQLQQDLRLAWTFDRGNLITGAYYGWDETKVRNDYFFYNEVLPIDALVALQVMPTNVYQTYDQERKSLALYGHGSWFVSDNVTLTAGLRWTDDEFSYKNGFAWLEVSIPDVLLQFYNGFAPINTVDHPVLGPLLGAAAGLTLPQQTIPGPMPLGVPPDFSNPLPDQVGNSDEVTGTLILDYKFNDDVMLYGSYSRGYRAGAFNGNGYLAPQQISFVEPEIVDAWEVGLKSRFLDDRVQLNTAAFFYDYKNNQFQNIVGIVSFLENAGKSEISGFEAELAAVLSDQFVLNLNVGYQDAVYEELSLLSPAAADGSLNGDTNMNGIIDVLLGEVGASLPINLNGNKMMNAPEWNVAIGADWSVYESDKGTLSLLPSANYVSDQFLSPFNGLAGNHRLFQDAYWLINGQLVWEAEQRYTARLWGRNLADETYMVYGIDIRSGFDVDYFTRGAPRAWGVDVTFRFD